MLITALLFNGCGNEEEGINENEPYLEITIGDDTWEPTDFTSVLTNISSLNGHRYDIFASNDDYQFFLAVGEENTSECIQRKIIQPTERTQMKH